jgi:multiple sugar transport system permease protein
VKTKWLPSACYSLLTLIVVLVFTFPFIWMLPISVPGIVTSGLLAFIFSWNNFMFSLILSGEKTKTLPIAVFNFISASSINWGGLMAVTCIIIMPVLIIALLTQKYVVSGLSAGAVKG